MKGERCASLCAENMWHKTLSCVIISSFLSDILLDVLIRFCCCETLTSLHVVCCKFHGTRLKYFCLLVIMLFGFRFLGSKVMQN